MTSSSHFSSLVLLLFAVTAGCTTVDESRLPSMDGLTDEAHSIMNDSLDSHVGAEVTDMKVAPVGHQLAPSREAIHTLRVGEELGRIVRQSDGVVLLDFYADWCGPCRKQARELQALEQFVAEVDGQVVKINVDEHQELARQYDVSSLPTLLAVKDGRVLQRKLGFTGRGELKSMLR